MTPNELRALADALTWVQYTADWQACHSAADYLRACADAQPVAWRCEVRGDGSNPAWDGFGWRHYHTTTSEREALAFVARSGNGIEGRAVPLYPHPAPAAPQAEPIDPHMIVAEDRFPDVPAEQWVTCSQCGEDVDRECPICDGLGRVLATDSEQAEPKREPLTYEQLVSACYTYRHDFGLLDPDEQELVIEEAGRWAKAFGIEGSDAQAEPKRKPLTLEQIDSLIERLFYHLRYEPNRVLWEHAVSIVRAVEHAHEIGGSDAE